MSSPPWQTQSPPIQAFLAMVLIETYSHKPAQTNYNKPRTFLLYEKQWCNSRVGKHRAPAWYQSVKILLPAGWKQGPIGPKVTGTTDIRTHCRCHWLYCNPYRQWRNWQGCKGASRPPWQAKCKNWSPSGWHFNIWNSLGCCSFAFFGVFSFLLPSIDIHDIRVHFHFLTFFWVLASVPYGGQWTHFSYVFPPWPKPLPTTLPTGRSILLRQSKRRSPSESMSCWVTSCRL